MAVNIDSELNTIENAVYGKEMRRAIHDALQKLANAINQGGGGGTGGQKVVHLASHQEHLNYMTNGDLDLDDVVLIDEDYTIMSHVTMDPEHPTQFLKHYYYDPVTRTDKVYIGEIYGTLNIGEPVSNEEQE